MPGPNQAQFDVIVIGAGVLGTFHALAAARRGFRTLLVERNCAPRDASVRNFGLLIPSALAPGPWLRRGLRTVEIVRELAEIRGWTWLRPGTQYLARTGVEAAVLAEVAHHAEAGGYRCQLLDRTESLAINPQINSEACRASLHFPDDLRIEPRLFLAEARAHFTHDLGGVFLAETVVIRAEVRGGVAEIETSAGRRFTARHVFVCSGSDLRTLLPNVYADSGLVHCKLQMLRLDVPSDFELPTSVASGLSLRRYPMFRNSQAAAGFDSEPIAPELQRRGIHVWIVQAADGSLVVGDSHAYAAEHDERLDAATENLILATARQMVGLEDCTVHERWHGVYTLHLERELFSRTLEERIHVVTGIGGIGMTAGPALAEENVSRIAALNRS